MIEITRKDNPSVGARILEIEKFSIRQLDEIVRFWTSQKKYNITVKV